MSAREKLGVAVIGCGRISRVGHLPYLADNKFARLVAGADLNEGNRESLCRKYGMTPHEDPIAMLDREKPSAVLICTPSWVHRELTLAAAERGIHVFCEKPMAVSSADCAAMLDACGKAGVNLQIGMAKRFDQGIAKAKRLTADGALGCVSSITTSFVNPPARLDSTLFQTVKKWASALGTDIEEKMGLWRMTDPRAGGGNLMEMGTHLLDIIMFICGETPVEHHGFINKKRPDMLWEDQGTIIAKFPSGLIGTVELNMSATADNLFGEKGVVYGDAGSLAFNLINGMWFGLPFYHHIPTLMVRYGAASPLLGAGAPVFVKTGRDVFMYKRQMDYFVDHALGRDTDYFGFGPDFATDGRDGLEVMKIIESVYAAARAGEAAAQ